MTDKQKNKVIQLLDDSSAVGKDLLDQFLWVNKNINTKFEVGDFVVFSIPGSYIWKIPCDNIYGTIESIVRNSDLKIIVYTIEVKCIPYDQVGLEQPTEIISKVKISTDDEYFSTLHKVKTLQPNIQKNS